MELTGKQVKHILYGEGKVEEMDDKSFRVAFGGEVGAKTFLYPSAFERFLTMCDAADQAEVQADVDAALEQARKDQERRDRIEAMKRHLTDSKRTAKRTSTRRKG